MSEIVEHCTHPGCEGGLVAASAPGILHHEYCPVCKGSTRRRRAFSSPESAVAIEPEERPAAAELARATLQRLLDEREAALQRSEAQCAALREALDQWGHDEACAHLFHRQLGRASEPTPACDCNIADALATDAGKALLEERTRLATMVKAAGAALQINPDSPGDLVTHIELLLQRLEKAEGNGDGPSHLVPRVRLEKVEAAHFKTEAALFVVRTDLAALRERHATAERERDEWWKRWHLIGDEAGQLRAQVEALTKEREAWAARVDAAERIADSNKRDSMDLRCAAEGFRARLEQAEGLIHEWAAKDAVVGDHLGKRCRDFLAAKRGAP